MRWFSRTGCEWEPWNGMELLGVSGMWREALSIKVKYNYRYMFRIYGCTCIAHVSIIVCL